jgi:Family of unknown function (DUF6932)
MIPEFTESGLLPEGIHLADMDEIQKRYGHNAHRQRLVRGLERALNALGQAGCKMLYLDGSFITAKEYPADYDACWEPSGVILAVLDPVFLDFSNRRAAQKAKYFGEFFPAHGRAEATSPFRIFLNFFQTDKTTGIKKGIIGIIIATTV